MVSFLYLNEKPGWRASACQKAWDAALSTLTFKSRGGSCALKLPELPKSSTEENSITKIVPREDPPLFRLSMRPPNFL